MRVMVIEFLEVDIFNVSAENSLTFLDPLIESWDIDIVSFGMEIVLNRRLAPGHPKKFEFVEQEPAGRVEQERGFKQFLDDPMLRGDADRGGNGVSRAADVHGQAANRALLLSRAAKPAGPPQLSARADRGRGPVAGSCIFIEEQDMTAWLWLILPAIAFAISGIPRAGAVATTTSAA